MVSVIIVAYDKYIINNLINMTGIQVRITDCTMRLVLYYGSKSIGNDLSVWLLVIFPYYTNNSIKQTGYLFLLTSQSCPW